MRIIVMPTKFITFTLQLGENVKVSENHEAEMEKPGSLER